LAAAQNLQPKTEPLVQVLSQNQKNPGGEDAPVLYDKKGDQNNDGEDEDSREDSGSTQTGIQEPEEDGHFGQEISEIAQGLEHRETTVEQLVDNATSKNNEVLLAVKDKVPESAEKGPETAIEKSQKGNQQAVLSQLANRVENDEKEDGEDEESQQDSDNGSKGVDAKSIRDQNLGRKPSVN